MIQRVYIIIKNSTKVRSFITACKNFIMSAKVFLFCGLGILYNIFSFIHHVLILSNNHGWLIDIVTTVCELILCAICLVSIWIILELLALIIEMKYPISAAEIEARCIDADSRCYPSNQQLGMNQPNTSEINVKRNFFAEELQSLRTTMSDSSAQHEFSGNLTQNVHFQPDCAPRPSSQHKLRHQFHTDINRPSTSVQRSKSLSSEIAKSTWNTTDYVEQRKYSPSIPVPKSLNKKKTLKISPLVEFSESSTSSLSDETNVTYKRPCTVNLFDHSKHSTSESPSRLCETSLAHSLRSKSDEQHSINETYFENNEVQVDRKRIESRREDYSYNEQFISKSNLEVNEPLENSSSDRTATASEGDSSWTEDSFVDEPFHGNPKSAFSNNSCIPYNVNISTIHKTLESNIKNSSEFGITTESEENNSACVQINSQSTIKSTSLNMKESDPKFIQTSVIKKNFQTNKKVETTAISGMDEKASTSRNETTTDDENGNVLEQTSKSGECPSALEIKGSDSTINAVGLEVKLTDSNEDARPDYLSKDVKTGTSTSVTDTKAKESLSIIKASSSGKDKTEATFLPTRTTDSFGVPTEIMSSSVAQSSVTGQTSRLSHISKLESLTFSVKAKEGTKIDSKPKMMAENFKRSLSTPVSEVRNVFSLKRKYESSSSDSSSENCSKETSSKRRAKRRTKSWLH